MGLLNSRWAIILPLIGLFMPFGVFWMRAHFLNKVAAPIANKMFECGMIP